MNLDNIKNKIFSVIQGLLNPQSVVDVPKMLSDYRTQQNITVPIQQKIT